MGLASQAGQVVTKEALIETVWPETVVSEGVLTACINTLRQALGENAQQPRYIATVHRVGYRFVAPVTRGGAPPPPAAPAAPPLPRPLAPAAGRGPRGRARRSSTPAGPGPKQGVRQTVFVTGEAGIGKTTLVEAFVAQLAPAAALLVRARAVHRTLRGGRSLFAAARCPGAAGPGPGRRAAGRVPAPVCPHLAGAAAGPAGGLTTGQRCSTRCQSTTRARMLRELVDALEVLDGGAAAGAGARRPALE